MQNCQNAYDGKTLEEFSSLPSGTPEEQKAKIEFGEQALRDQQNLQLAIGLGLLVVIDGKIQTPTKSG